MIIEFIIGVSIFSHDVIIHQLWIEGDIQPKPGCPSQIEIPLRYKRMQVRYPVGYI